MPDTVSRPPARPFATGLLLAASIALAACSDERARSSPALYNAESLAAPAPVPLARHAGMAGRAGVADTASVAEEGVRQSQEQRHIAVRHMLTVESPGDRLPALWEKVRANCEALRCEVLAASLRQETPRQGAGASLSLRVAPEDAQTLLGALQAGGAVVQHDSHSEDLTAQVVDVEAHIRNRTEFRDSLRALLATTDGRRALKDVLEIQRTLTQTQSQLDSHATQLKALQSRTRMQQVDIEFRAERRVVGGGSENPIVQAWREAGDTLARSAAALLSFLALVLPWLPLPVLLLWTLRRLWRRRACKARVAGAATGVAVH